MKFLFPYANIKKIISYVNKKLTIKRGAMFIIVVGRKLDRGRILCDLT
jgi:hypothetical protein